MYREQAMDCIQKHEVQGDGKNNLNLGRTRTKFTAEAENSLMAQVITIMDQMNSVVVTRHLKKSPETRELNSVGVT